MAGVFTGFPSSIESGTWTIGDVLRRAGRTGLFGVSEKMLTGLTNAYIITPISTVNKRQVCDDTFSEVKYIFIYNIDIQLSI
ncbi:MAG: hypothetical protein K2O30_07015, partial [Duncaniella sp.]|nr:hypothetical protein [Duncaniella sp.]